DVSCAEAISNLCDPHFLRFGLDLLDDGDEKGTVGDERPTWEISERVARMVLGERGSLWESLSPQLAPLQFPIRVRLVEQLARYLTFKQVPYLADLLAGAHAAGLTVDPIESAAMLHFVPSFWQTLSGQEWLQQLRTFLEYFSQRDPVQQAEILDGP